MAVNDVVIDFNGFVLAGSPWTGHGIYQDASYRNLTVRHGTASGWHGANNYGILAAGSGNRMEDVTVCDNYNGLYCGEGARIYGCVAISNQGDGFIFGLGAGDGSVIFDCIAEGNWSSGTNCCGIMVGNGSTLTRCASYGHWGPGLCCGIYAGEGSILSDCTAVSNSAVADGYGISAGAGALVSECSASENSGSTHNYGIWCGENSRVSRCAAFANRSAGGSGAGIYVQAGGLVTGCASVRNRMYGASYGIAADRNVAVEGCAASRNGSTMAAGYGIYTEKGGRVSGSSACDNTGGATNGAGIRVNSSGGQIRRCAAHGNHKGIWATARSEITENACSMNNIGVVNEAGGIYVGGTHNRIDGNLATWNYYVAIQSAGSNVVVRNMACNNEAPIWTSSGDICGQTVTYGWLTNALPWVNFDL